MELVVVMVLLLFILLLLLLLLLLLVLLLQWAELRWFGLGWVRSGVCCGLTNLLTRPIEAVGRHLPVPPSRGEEQRVW